MLAGSPEAELTVVVTDNCMGCRFTECVSVCPVACFHGDEQMLYIDRDVCIDCGSCIPVCPVSAIYDLIDLPSEKAAWDGINRERAPKHPVVDCKMAPLPGAVGRRTALGFAEPLA